MPYTAGFFFCKKFRNLYTVIPPQTGQIWSLFLYTYGVKWVMPDSIRSLLESGRVNRQEKGQRRYGRLFLYEISKRCFEDHRLHIPMLKIYATTICNFSKYTTWFSFQISWIYRSSYVTTILRIGTFLKFLNRSYFTG